MTRFGTLALVGLMVVLCAGDARAGAKVPFSLTGSDGTGLRVVALKAKVVVDGPLAFTELHLTFRNAENRQREGRFEITLPPTAAISRFAMKIDGRWQEGEVVERQRARRIYERIVHQSRDPALLEKKAGNGFRARIFPIAARSNKELRISYSEELVSSSRPYRLRLRGLPRLGRLRIQAQVRRQTRGRVRWQRRRLARRNYFPRGDFTLRSPKGIRGLRAGNLVVVRVAPRIPARAAALKTLLILFDTSASRAPGFLRQVSRLGRLIRALRRQGKGFRLKVACFDQSVRPVFTGTAAGFSAKHLRRIRSRGALGASNLEAAMSWAARQRGYGRLLLVSDGVATAGGTRVRLNRALVRARDRIQRLDVVAVGGIRDEPRLRDLVVGVLRQDGVVLDEDLSATRLAERLRQSVHTRVRVSVPGASWVWPRTLASLQPGSEALVYAQLPAGRVIAGGAVTVQLSGRLDQRHRVVLSSTQRPLLERAWVRSRIQWLSTLGDSAFVRSRMVELSVRHRVLSEHTALLVLETAADYRTYGLRRRGLADILTVGRRGVVLRKRSLGWVRRHVRSRRRSGRLRKLSAARGTGSVVPARPRGRNGFWNLAHRSRSRGGPVILSVAQALKNAARRRRRAGRWSRPTIFSTRFVMSGGLDAATIRRIIRRQLNAVRHCYQRELQLHPRLEGQVKLAFIIGRTGRVVWSRIASSTLNNRAVETCIVRLSRRWRFSAADAVDMPFVTYPFNFINRTVAQAQPSPVVAAPKKPVKKVRRVRRPRPRPVVARAVTAPVAAPVKPKPKPDPLRAVYSGKLLRLQVLLRAKQTKRALALARRWRAKAPGSLLALVGLGQVLEASGRRREAARAYGSIIDLFPSRADLRRYAGNRLAALGKVGLPLARDTYARALVQRPDHAHGYRLLAYTQVRLGQPTAALRTLERGLSRKYPRGRFSGVKRVLRADLGVVARVILKRYPRRRGALTKRLKRFAARIDSRASVRAVLTWETDANDMDLRVGRGDPYLLRRGSPAVDPTDELYENVTNGYGPECIIFVKGYLGRRGPLRVTYTGRGPMGYGLGTVSVMRHDGRGGLRFDERPFVIMKDGATLNLGGV